MSERTKRRDAGSGSLYHDDAKGLWVVVVELPPRNGKRRRKTIRRKDKAAAQAALNAAMKDLQRAGDLPTASPTVAAWLASWIDRRERNALKPRTATTYRGYIDRHIVPTIGRVRLERLTTTHVERLHDSMLAAGCSSTSALQAHRILAVALRDAERAGLVMRNVATLTDAPSKAVAVRPALTAEQARALLLSVADSPDLAPQWAVALLAGLRQGERLGLCREQVDLERGIITVSWQLQRLRWRHGCERAGAGWSCGRTRAGWCPERTVTIPPDQEAERVHGGLWLTRPKTRAGWREVPIAPGLTDVLARHIEQAGPGPAGLIFHTSGRPIDPSDDAAAWDASLRAAGLPDVPLHSARHTCSTLLYELGVDEQTRQAILGHSSATVTRGYTHVATPMMRDGIDRLDVLLLDVHPNG